MLMALCGLWCGIPCEQTIFMDTVCVCGCWVVVVLSRQGIDDHCFLLYFFHYFLMNDQWIIFVGCLFFCQFWLGFSRSLVGLLLD